MVKSKPTLGTSTGLLTRFVAVKINSSNLHMPATGFAVVDSQYFYSPLIRSAIVKMDSQNIYRPPTSFAVAITYFPNVNWSPRRLAVVKADSPNIYMPT